MAKLKLPTACTACGNDLAAGDHIVFERTARVRSSYGYTYDRVTDEWLPSGPLVPHVSPTSPKNVRHINCENPSGR